MKSRKTKHKLDLSKIRAAITNNDTFTTIESTKRMQYIKNNFDEYKQKSENMTPFEN
jgi:hypothetical protein